MKKKYTFLTYNESGKGSAYSYYQHSKADVVVYAENEQEAYKKVKEIHGADQYRIKIVEKIIEDKPTEQI